MAAKQATGAIVVHLTVATILGRKPDFQGDRMREGFAKARSTSSGQMARRERHGFLFRGRRLHAEYLKPRIAADFVPQRIDSQQRGRQRPAARQGRDQFLCQQGHHVNW